jgi:hypothetical protein
VQRSRNPCNAGVTRHNTLLWETRGRRFKSSRSDQSLSKFRRETAFGNSLSEIEKDKATVTASGVESPPERPGGVLNLRHAYGLATAATTATATSAAAATTACITQGGIVDRIEVVDRPRRGRTSLPPTLRRHDVDVAAAKPPDRLIAGDHGRSGSRTGCGAHRNESDESSSRQIQFYRHLNSPFHCRAKPEWFAHGVRRGQLETGSNGHTAT